MVERATAAAHGPAGGLSLLIGDGEGRRIEVVHGDARRTPDEPAPPDQPQRLAHAVLNCHAIARTQAFVERALGFVLADRTRIMAFMNCDADHHTIAFGDNDNDALNHIAFVMPTFDAVMRGGGRLNGIVIEYTAEVEQIDDNWQVAHGNGNFVRRLAQMAKLDLLVDDFAISAMGPAERCDLLDDRIGTRSTLITSQLPVKAWHTDLGDPTRTDAILDRVVNNSHKIELKVTRSRPDSDAATAQ